MTEKHLQTVDPEDAGLQSGAGRNEAPAIVEKAETALAKEAIQSNSGLLAVLNSKTLEPAAQRDAVAAYKERFSFDVSSQEFNGGITKVIQWLTVLENTFDGIELLDIVEQEDILDLKNPVIAFGLILYYSKEKANPTIRRDVLERIIEMYDPQGIAELIHGIDKLDLKDKDLLREAFVRMLLSIALKNFSGEVNSDPDLEPDSIMECIVDRDYSDLLGTDADDDPAVKVLTAVGAYDPELELSLVRELVDNAKIARHMNKNRRHDSEDIKAWIKSSAKFSGFLNSFLSQSLPKVRQAIIDEIVRISNDEGGEVSRKMLAEVSSATEEVLDATEEVREENETVDEEEIEL